MRRAVEAILLGAANSLMPPISAAHVSMTSGRGFANANQTIKFGVGHGCDAPSSTSGGSWLLSASAPFALLALGVCFEGLQLIAPERFDLVEPRAELAKGLEAQAIHPHPRIVAFRPFLDDARPPQDTQMTARERAAERKGGGDVTRS